MIAYTRYSFFEWGLIFLDVLYDSSAELDFRSADLKVRCIVVLCMENAADIARQIVVGSFVGVATDADKMYQQLYRLA